VSDDDLIRDMIIIYEETKEKEAKR